ncbi:AAA family ATPase [uncultured Bradyrhizobium sp.]|uniref:AAA family ATPase n=1 Tax=uncultured Bradyrhizobium sp. TaxID=199684 RepID=UPI0035CB5DF3
MTEYARLQIRHVSFLGPNKPTAVIHFKSGFNVLYGASDTGKSFILDTIDYMLGGKGPLRDFPEREGYDRVLLGMQVSIGEFFTLQRSVAGGGFLKADGLHEEAFPKDGVIELREQHDERKDDNLSRFLLGKIGLLDRRVRRNKHNETNSLSFRNLARLAIVDEEEIIQKRSPLSDGNVVADTPNTATFKLLLTGADDSALVAARSSPQEHSRAGQIELLGQLIAETQTKIRQLSGPPKQLEDQDAKLEETLRSRMELLAAHENVYKDATSRRREVRQRLDLANERLTEVSVLLERFDLLSKHYQSDVERLEGIREGGTLFSELSDGVCPLCGADPAHQHRSEDCEGNADQVVIAAEAELGKIGALQQDLAQTVRQLTTESRGLQNRIPKLEADVFAVNTQIQDDLAPKLRAARTSYAELADKRAEVREALGLFENIQDLEDRRTKLELEEAEESGGNAPDAGLPTGSLDKFATVVQEILKTWHFPNADRVHFEQKIRDLVIGGKNRTSFGKGLRAITQSAFTIGLLQYCMEQQTPHPGFALLDSPLLSYKEPDGEDDDMRHTDLKAQFYNYLKNIGIDRQVIIVENTDPPDDVRALPNAQKFTGNPSEAGRAGLFPTSKPTTST